MTEEQFSIAKRLNEDIYYLRQAIKALDRGGRILVETQSGSFNLKEIVDNKVISRIYNSAIKTIEMEVRLELEKLENELKEL